MSRKKTRRQYSDDFKIQLIEDLAAKKLRTKDAIEQHGVYSSMLNRWRNQYKAGELKRGDANGTALVPAEQTQPVEVLTAKRKYVKRSQPVEVLTKRKYTKRGALAPALSAAEATVLHNEMAFYLDRSCRRLIAAIQAGQIGVEELTRGYTVDLLTAANAARGGK